LIDRALQCHSAPPPDARQQIRRRLKTQQQALKTLQQRIVQIPLRCVLRSASRSSKRTFISPGQLEHPQNGKNAATASAKATALLSRKPPSLPEDRPALRDCHRYYSSAFSGQKTP